MEQDHESHGDLARHRPLAIVWEEAARAPRARETASYRGDRTSDKEKNMSTVITDSNKHPSFNIPGRVINLDQARVRHGDNADHMVRMLAVGDPLADAGIVEMDALGTEGRRILNAGLAGGLESLTEHPPAITALLEQLETLPAWVDPDMLGRGEVVALSVSPFWYLLCAIPSALVHTYASPAIARLLTQTGRLTTMALRRVAETGMWAGQATMPGGLLRGAPGYQATVQVRLLHARMRSNALKHGCDTAEWGVPISQVDVARTCLDWRTTASIGTSPITTAPRS